MNNATPLMNYVAPLNELRYTPNELGRTLNELRHTPYELLRKHELLINYVAPLNELRHTLNRIRRTRIWATLQPFATPLMNYVAPVNELRHIHKSWSFDRSPYFNT
jgi:hypothetical protein